MASSFASKKAPVHSFPRSEALRALVDAAVSDGGTLANDLVQYERAYELIRGAFSQEDAAYTHQTVSHSSPTDIFYDLRLVAQEIVWAEILVPAPLEPYFSIANILRDALRHSDGVPELSMDDPAWVEAVRVAVAYNRNRPKEGIQEPAHKDTTFARAVLYFIKRGINLRLSGQVLPLSVDERHKLAATAYRPLMAMGDVKAMKVVEDLLSPKFDGKIKRLRLHPNPDMMGQKMDRSIPYGYLYRVALKTLGRARTNLSTKEMAEKVVVLCTNLGAVFNVEPFSQYETMFAPRPGKVLEVLREIIVYDELFTIPQCTPDLAKRVIYNLFGGIDIEGQEGWSTEDAMVLLDVLLVLTMDFVKSKFVTKSDLHQRLSARVGERRAEKLVRSFVLGPVNNRYELPADALQAETRECMLVRASKGHLWVPGQLFLVPAFYNRMISLYSRGMKGASSAIGKAFERHFEQRIKSKLIPYMKGDYGSKRRIDGDVDLAVETDDTIVLFELKKKNLRRATFGGNDLQLAVDLSQGLVHGVNQLAKQEMRLRKEGRINFRDGRILEWRGRRIIKVVLSSFDYGGLHETVVVHHALRSLCGASLAPRLDITEEQRVYLDRANEEFACLGRNFASFRQVVGDGGRLDEEFFWNIRFLEIFFMERVLEFSKNAEDLVRLLSAAGRVITGRRDPHFDFDYSQGLHGAAARAES